MKRSNRIKKAKEGDEKREGKETKISKEKEAIKQARKEIGILRRRKMKKNKAKQGKLRYIFQCRPY